MRILFITKLLPYPLDAGGKLKTYKILNLLSQEHEVHFVSLVDKKSDQNYEIEIKKLCKSVKTFVFPIINQNHKIRLAWKLLLSILSFKPFTVYKYYFSEMEKYIIGFLQHNMVDLLYIDHLTMAQYIPTNYKRKVVCDEHNICYLAFQSYTEKENNPLLRFIYLLESIKLYAFEKNYFTRFNHIFAISEIDRKRIINIGVRSEKITYLPIPFDNPYLFNNSYSRNPTIVFVGLLSWLPNEFAIDWFIKQVFPIIKKNIPNISFIILGKYGKKIKSYLGRLNDRNSKYVGYIKNLKPYYNKSNVFVAPILMGGGVRMKILEAMSYGLPIVSTTIGAEGISTRDGRELLIRDSPEDFAAGVIEVINDRNISEKLSQNAYKFIRRNYNDSRTKKVLKIIEVL